MRQIGTIQNDDDAIRFSDYLLASGIPNMVEESTNGGWSVWIENDDQLEQGKAELEAFNSAPSDVKYTSASRHAEKIRKTEEKQRERRRTQYIDVRTRWGQPRQWAAPVTLGLIILCCVVAVPTRLGGQMQGAGETLLIESSRGINEQIAEETRQGTLTPQRLDRLLHGKGSLTEVRRGQVWRLITPIFIHYGIIHLIFNLFWLRDLGGMIELNRGSLFLLTLTIASALISNLAQHQVTGTGFGGMSGVNYALFGYLWMKTRYVPHLNMIIGPQVVWIMLAWLVISGLLVPNVAHAAHVVGLVVGLFVGYAPVAYRKMRRGIR